MDISLKAARTFQADIAARLSNSSTRDEQSYVDAFVIQYFCRPEAVEVVNHAMI